MAHLKKRHQQSIKILAMEVCIACFCEWAGIPTAGERRGAEKPQKGSKLDFAFKAKDGIADHCFVGHIEEIKSAEKHNWFTVSVVGFGEGYQMLALEFDIYAGGEQLEIDESGFGNAAFMTWTLHQNHPYSKAPLVTQYSYDVSLDPVVVSLVETFDPYTGIEEAKWILDFTKRTGLLN